MNNERCMRLFGTTYTIAYTFGLMIFVCSGCSCANSYPPERPITVSMKLSKLDTNECIIEVTIVNNGKKNLTFDENNLPWHFVENCVTLALIEEDHLLREPIRRTPIIVDSYVGVPIAIKPRERKSEQVHLDRYYNDLNSALLRHDVTMLWVYRPKPANVEELEPIVGQLKLPQIKK